MIINITVKGKYKINCWISRTLKNVMMIIKMIILIIVGKNDLLFGVEMQG